MYRAFYGIQKFVGDTRVNLVRKWNRHCHTRNYVICFIYSERQKCPSSNFLQWGSFVIVLQYHCFWKSLFSVQPKERKNNIIAMAPGHAENMRKCSKKQNWLPGYTLQCSRVTSLPANHSLRHLIIYYPLCNANKLVKCYQRLHPRLTKLKF